MRTRRGTAYVAGSVVLVLAAACAPQQRPEADRPGRSAESPAPLRPKECIQRQRRATWPAGPRLQVLTRRVLSGADEAGAAAERFAEAIGGAAQYAGRVCGDGAEELAGVVELARTASEGEPDEALLRQLVDAFEAWGQKVGRTRETRILYAADPCEAMREHVEATYAIRRRPESGGEKVWVVVAVANQWSERVYLDHGGRIEATNVRPGGATRTYDWGGSSSDTAAAAPGRTSRDPVHPVPATGPEPYLHLYPGGEVRVLDLYGSAYGRFGTCTIELTGPG